VAHALEDALVLLLHDRQQADDAVAVDSGGWGFSGAK